MVKLKVEYDHMFGDWYWKVELNGTENYGWAMFQWLAVWKAKRAIKRINKTQKFLEGYSGKA